MNNQNQYAFEMWFDIKGYEGIYKISNYYRIKSLKRKITKVNGHSKWINEKIRPTFINKNRYHVFALSKNGITKTHFVHVEIAKIFHPNPDNLPETNHLDGDKDNNHPINLKWVTRHQNIEHAFRTGLIIPATGVNQSNTKLTEDQVLKIFNDKRATRTIAKDYGVVHSAIVSIKTGKSWSHLTGLPRKTKRKYEIDHFCNQS